MPFNARFILLPHLNRLLVCKQEGIASALRDAHERVARLDEERGQLQRRSRELLEAESKRTQETIVDLQNSPAKDAEAVKNKLAMVENSLSDLQRSSDIERAKALDAERVAVEANQKVSMVKSAMEELQKATQAEIQKVLSAERAQAELRIAQLEKQSEEQKKVIRWIIYSKHRSRQCH